MDDWRDWLVLSVVLVVLGGLGWLGWITWVHARGADACLARGYPEVRLDHWGTVYCVKTVNGTTVVVPLQEAR